MKIEFKNVSFHYPNESDVLKNVSFIIESGQMTSIIGHNGSCKSTLAKLLMGLIEPTSGEIYIDDVLLNESSISSIRNKMGIIFQNPDNQFVGVTVKDDIAFGLENKNIERSKMLELISDYSKLVKMDSYLEANPENLSGGQKQRVAIAGVLAMNTECVIFDEATSMLDPLGVKEINETVKMLKKQAKKTIISITHNIEETLYSEKVLVLNNGVLVLSGTPKDVLLNVEVLKQAGLDTLESVKLINVLGDNHQEIKEELWKLIFEM
jgi:energy-coupling factor transport system ATP-binding protein